MHAVASESVRSSPNKVRTKSLVAHIPVSSVSKSQRALSFGILTTSPSGHLFHISPHAILRFFPYTQQCRYPLSMPSVWGFHSTHRRVRSAPIRFNTRRYESIAKVQSQYQKRERNFTRELRISECVMFNMVEGQEAGNWYREVKAGTTQRVM
jgi:hypothetical protein